jgi:uncharacterized protein involved in exopolysaccharide biosynthesis
MTEKDFPLEETTATIDGASSPVAPSHNYEVSLIDVLLQLAYRKWLIAKVAGVAMLVGLVICFVLPVNYTATTKIMTPQQSTSSTALMNQLSSSGTSSMAALAVGGGLGLKDPNTIYIGLITSRPIADAIIQKFGLDKVYHSNNMTDARKKLADRTVVISEKNGFISVSVTDRDKKRVAEMANAYTSELRTLMKTLAVTEASQRRLFFEEQLMQAKDALVTAELTFQQVQQQKGLVQLDAQAKSMIDGLAALRALVAAKQVEVQALRSYSTEQNPDVQLAESELASLQAEKSRLEQRHNSQGISGLGLENVPSAGLEYLRAEHELQYRQALYEMLMKQYDAAKLDEAKDAAIIQVVEPAIEPDQKAYPKRALILLISMFIGLLIGCVLTLFVWWKDIVQSDPIVARQLQEFKHLIFGQKA